MAYIYNFGLAGVAGQVQFGKGGTQLLSNSGTFSAVAADGSTFVRFQIADPVGNSDAVTLTKLQNVATQINANVATLTTEVRGVETGAGLTSGTGAYVAPSGTNYLGSATSLFSADVLLDTAINAVQTYVGNIETAVGLSNTGTFVPFSGTNYLDGSTSIVNALALLDSSASSGASAVAAESARAEAAEANIAANLLSNVTTLTNLIDDVNTSLMSDNSDLTAEIDGVQSNVTANVTQIYVDLSATNANVGAEILRAESAENVLTGSIMSEVSRAEGAEMTLTNAINFEVSRAESAESTLTTNLSAEVSRAEAAESTLNTAITNEGSRAMAAEAALLANIAAETFRAEAAENVLTDAVSNIQATYVHIDGSTPFLGNVSMSGFQVQNVANPVNLGDAVNLQYLNSAISSIGSAFNYVGVLSNAASDANSATDLEFLTGPSGASLTTGDYWKSANEGFYKSNASATPFFVQANDGIVFNTTGGFDVIAHVDSVVYGSPGNIAVTGSVDTGWTVNIDTVFQGRVSGLEANVINNTNLINTETQRAEMAENAITVALTAETTRAVTAENLLNSNIVTEFNRANTAETTLTNSLATEVARAEAAESSISANVATVEASVGLNTFGNYVVPVGSVYLQNTTTVMGALLALDMAANTGTSSTSVEMTRAMAAEANIAANVAANFSTLTSNIATVQSNVAAETVRATTAEALLNANAAADYAALTNTINLVQSNVTSDVVTLDNTIAVIENSVGLASDGTFVGFAGSNFLTNATSVANAISLLDGELQVVLTDLEDLTTYQIITSSGLTSVSVNDANGVVTNLDVGGVATQVMNVVGSASTNSTLTVDFSVANTVSFVANGTGATVDIRLEPKGSGQVYVGQAGVAGVMQAEPGQSLEVAGGDSTTGSGGALILRGGLGNADPTNSGLVQIADASNHNVATFAGVANSNTFFSFMNGSNAATLAVSSSSTSGDLVLTPKGTGNVNVSNAKIQNVQTGVASTDAVNVGQMNTAIVSAVTAAQTGLISSVYVNITETTGAVAIGAPVSGLLIRARVFVTSAFASGTTIEVGTAMSGSDLLTPDQIDGTLTGNAFVGDVLSTVSNQQLYVTVAASGGSAGTATVFVEYIHS